MRTNKQALREQVIIDISKHPLIKQAYEVCQAIENAVILRSLPTR